jgi:hypothetical protein
MLGVAAMLQYIDDSVCVLFVCLSVYNNTLEIHQLTDCEEENIRASVIELL